MLGVWGGFSFAFLLPKQNQGKEDQGLSFFSLVTSKNLSLSIF